MSKRFSNLNLLKIASIGVIVANTIVCLRYEPWLAFITIPTMFALYSRRSSLMKEAVTRAQDRLPFELLVHNNGDMIAMSNKYGVVEYVNPHGRSMVGLGADQDITQIDREMFYPDADWERMKTEIMPQLKANGHWTGELNYRHHQSREAIPVSANFIQLRDPETQEHHGIALIGRDLRELKKLERKLDRFFEVSLDMLAIANVQGYFLKLNPAFCEILGYTAEELMSKPATAFIHPDDIQATIEQLVRQAGGHPVLSFENRYRTAAGDYRWFSWKSFPDGDITYGAARDITDSKFRQNEMQELNRRAVAASQAKSQFLANMSHEIRTPINGVVGMTNLLLETSLNEQQLDYAENIKASSETLLTVINDILDFSKVEAGKLDLETLDFNIESLVDETAKSISWVIRNKSLPFTVDADRGFKHLFKGDPGRIRQVLNNLLSNAVKFTSQGMVRFEVRALEKREHETKFKFAVHDTGIGVSEDERKKLFQAFSQADASTSRRFGGTGLGLSISKQLIDLMGGEIAVDSVAGVGSMFWFTLTLAHAAEIVQKSAPQALLEKTKHPNARLLVAEDNFVNQKILLAMLDKMGFKPQTVGNGREVLVALEDRDYDLILMDCQMPELDGYEATRRIRASGRAYASIPVIALTANALKGDREVCLAAGMDDYASKPVAAAELATVIEHWLDAAARKKRTA